MLSRLSVNETDDNVPFVDQSTDSWILIGKAWHSVAHQAIRENAPNIARRSISLLPSAESHLE